DPKRARRLILAVGAGSLLLGAGLGYVLRRPQPAVPSTRDGGPADPRRDWAHAKALGSLTELIASSGSFLVYVEANGGDETLWRGVDRLADAAVLGVGGEEETTALRARLVERLRSAALPKETADRLVQVAALLNPPKRR